MGNNKPKKGSVKKFKRSIIHESLRNYRGGPMRDRRKRRSLEKVDFENEYHEK